MSEQFVTTAAGTLTTEEPTKLIRWVLRTPKPGKTAILFDGLEKVLQQAFIIRFGDGHSKIEWRDVEEVLEP